MNLDEIRDILNKLLSKECSIEEAEKLLKANAIEEVGDFAKLDIYRKLLESYALALLRLFMRKTKRLK